MIRVPATFDRFSSRADGSLGLSFTTQEVDIKELSDIHGHVRSFGWLLFKDSEIQDDDIPDEEPDRDDISPSKRLYNVLYAYYAQLKEQGKADEPFRVWREKKMEAIINAYKEKLT